MTFKCKQHIKNFPKDYIDGSAFAYHLMNLGFSQKKCSECGLFKVWIDRKTKETLKDCSKIIKEWGSKSMKGQIIHKNKIVGFID